LNYIIRIGQGKYLLRINVEQQSGLADQIEYEYKALKYLEGYKIVPKAHFVDNSKRRLPFGLLVEEYLEGEYLDYDDLSGVMDAAWLLAILHKISLPGDNFLVTWPNALEGSLSDVVEMLRRYTARESRKKEIADSSAKLIRRLEKNMGSEGKMFRSDSIVHTDVVNDNFIRSREGLRLIDWEKPRIDDESYDLCCFLGTPSQVWSSPRAMTEEERGLFLAEYARRSGGDLKEIKEKVRTRQPFVSLHWILWAATRLSELKEGLIAPELMEFHSRNIPRYGKVARAEYIEDLLKQVG
jgi:thiamine kinase-like enzyme